MSWDPMDDCVWCFDPATQTAVVAVGVSELEVDLCDRHLQELLEGARTLAPETAGRPAVPPA
jgi:hypothetical protein